MKELLGKTIDVGVDTGAAFTGKFIADDIVLAELLLDSGQIIKIVKSHIAVFGEHKPKMTVAKHTQTESNTPPVAIPTADPVPEETNDGSEEGERMVVAPVTGTKMPVKVVDGSSSSFTDEVFLHRCLNNENKCPGVRATFKKGKNDANKIMTAGCPKKASTCIFLSPKTLSECKADDMIRMLDETLFGNYPTK